MKTALIIAPILLLSSLIVMAAAPSNHRVPPLRGKDLNGKPWEAPSGWPGERTLLLVGFEREQQAAIDSWTDGLKLNSERASISWIEMPVIDDPGAFMRWFIDSGMKGGIPDAPTRAHVWTAYTSRKKLMEACGMSGPNTVYALVVDRTGRIYTIESGNFSEAGGARLLKALKYAR